MKSLLRHAGLWPCALLFLLLLSPLQTAATNYYVSPAGTNASPGTSPGSPTSIQNAFAKSNYVSGDKIYVLSGNYGAQYLTVACTTSNVQFIGVLNLTTLQEPGTVFNRDVSNSYSFTQCVSNFPTLVGEKSTLAAKQNAITLINKSGITLRNFHFKNYCYGIYAQTCSTLTVQNCIFNEMWANVSGHYGYAVLLSYSHYSSIRNCYALNVESEAFAIVGNNNLVEYSRSYCTAANPAQADGTGGTDYHFVISSTSTTTASNNVIRFCRAEKLEAVPYTGKGLCVSGYVNAAGDLPMEAADNRLENCFLASGLAINLRSPNTRRNIFTNIELGENTWGILFNESPSDNTFEKVKSTTAAGLTHAIVFGEDGYLGPTTNSGNIFSNCLFKAYYDLFTVRVTVGCSSIAVTNNTFLNCTLVSYYNLPPSFSPKFLNFDRWPAACSTASVSFTANRFINCIIDNFNEFSSNSGGFSSVTSNNNSFYHGNFYRNGSAFTGALVFQYMLNCTSNNPNFVNGGNVSTTAVPVANYHLASATGGAANRGTTLVQLCGYGSYECSSATAGDLDGLSRAVGSALDIGCFEYQSATKLEEAQLETGILLYPNPAQDVLTVSGNDLPGLILFLHDLQGRQVMSRELANAEETLFIGDLPPGIYLATLRGRGTDCSQKIMITR